VLPCDWRDWLVMENRRTSIAAVLSTEDDMKRAAQPFGAGQALL
jgi:hypothetical protein